MKKVFTILSEVFLITAAILVVVTAILGFVPQVMGDGSEGMPMTGGSLVGLSAIVIGTFASLFVGLFLRHNKNDIARNIGRALILTAFLTVGIYALGAIISMTYIAAPAIIGLVALILFGIHYVFEFVLWIIGRAVKEYDEGKPADK